MTATSPRYDTINEPVTVVSAYIPELHDWRPVRAVRFLLGRRVQPDPDAQLKPDNTLFPRRDDEARLAAIRAAAARKAAETDLRVYKYLRRRGPCSVSAMCSGLGTSDSAIYAALKRRPDWFVPAGEKRGKNGNMTTLWGVAGD